jgi:hypothetical protein
MAEGESSRRQGHLWPIAERRLSGEELKQLTFEVALRDQ